LGTLARTSRRRDGHLEGGEEDEGSITGVSSVVADIMFENHAAYMGAKADMNHVKPHSCDSVARDQTQFWGRRVWSRSPS